MIDKSLIIARELLSPALSDEFQNRFTYLKQRLNIIHPCRMEGAIRSELNAVIPNNLDNPESLDSLKKASFLSFLCDLLSQDWHIEIENGNLYIYLLNDSMSAKESIRHRLQAERRAQFQSRSVQTFIRMMEQEKQYHEEQVSISALIADPNELLEKIHEYQRGNYQGQMVEPYIQLVTNEKDEFTGYRLGDIWRYFRYTWSIP